MAPKKTTRKKAAKKKVPRKPSAKSAKKARRASKAPKKVAPKRKVAKKSSAKKSSARKVVKKSPAKKSAAKKTPAKKAAVKKAAAKRPAAKKPAAKKPAAKKPAAKKPAASPWRRDNSGHISAAYAEKLREQSGESSSPEHAFLDGPRSNDSLAEELGEETVGAMTTGEDVSDRLEQEVDEDGGGPFVETDGSDEFADGVDESNPESATREPFPTS